MEVAETREDKRDPSSKLLKRHSNSHDLVDPSIPHDHGNADPLGKGKRLEVADVVHQHAISWLPDARTGRCYNMGCEVLERSVPV
jgi:hypothetical protein